jgi:hypothetical protein
MTTLEVGQKVIALWGVKKKEYPAKIMKINDDGKTVKLSWDETTKDGKMLISSKFLISNLKINNVVENDDEDVGVTGIFDVDDGDY